MTASWSINVTDWQNFNPLQQTGQSTIVAMSQKAVTDEISRIVDEIRAYDKDHIYNSDIYRNKWINNNGILSTEGTRGVAIAPVLENVTKIESESGRSFSFYSGIPDLTSGSNFIEKNSTGDVPSGAKYVGIVYLLTYIDANNVTIIQREGQYLKIAQIENVLDPAFDSLDMVDSTEQASQSQQLDITLRKNNGTNQVPDWRPLAVLTLPKATNSKAGLMSAEDKDNVDSALDEIFTVKPIVTDEDDLTSSLSPYTESKAINHVDGSLYISGGYHASFYADIRGYDKIRYKRPKSTSPSTALGMAFYNASNVYISGQQALISQTADGYVETELDVPEGAVYVRLSENNDTENWGFQELIGINIDYERSSKIEELEGQASTLEGQVSTIEGQVSTLAGQISALDGKLTKREIFGQKIITIEGKVITTDGSESASYAANKGCTGYIDISDLIGGYITSRFIISRDSNYAANIGLAFYNENKEFISFEPSVKGSETGSVNKTLQVPEGAKYIRTSYWLTASYVEDYGDFYLEYQYSSIDEINKELAFNTIQINSLDQRVENLEEGGGSPGGRDNTLVLNQQDIVELNKIGADGNYSADLSMGCTDYIPCHGAESLTYKRVIGLIGAGLAFYDENKGFLSYVDSLTGTNGLITHAVDVPSNAYYFRASGWNYVNSLTYGAFSASLTSPNVAVDGKRVSNGECTFFSVLYNRAIDDLSKTTFGSYNEQEEFIPNPSQVEELVCTTAVVLLPPNYTPTGKPCRVILNFHGWSHYVNYKVWGLPSRLGFIQQKQRWANAGYAVIDVNLKNSSQKGNYSGLGSIQVDDSYRKAFEWVKKNYNVEETCFVVCGSAGGPNGINVCYNWPDVRAGVWLDTWINVSEHSYVGSCGSYYYGYTESYDATRVGTRNPMSKIKTIDGVDYLMMPKCPVKLYPLSNAASFMKPFVDIIDAGNAIGDFYIRRCSGISHSDLVSGGEGTDPQSAVVDEEIINFLNQH